MPAKPLIEQQGSIVLLRVRVQPKASRNALEMTPTGICRVAITTPPIDGAANKAVCAFIAKTLGLPKRSVTIAGGERSRDKTVAIVGVTARYVETSLLS